MEILIENQSVKAEFDRWCEYFGDHDPYTANGNIGIRDVLRAHFLIAAFFKVVVAPTAFTMPLPEVATPVVPGSA